MLLTSVNPLDFENMVCPGCQVHLLSSYLVPGVKFYPWLFPLALKPNHPNTTAVILVTGKDTALQGQIIKDAIKALT
jgi:hypothetical protein